MRYAYKPTNGLIYETTQLFDDDLPIPEGFIEYDGTVCSVPFYISKSGEYKSVPSQPSPYHEWDNAIDDWALTDSSIFRLRNELKQRINAKRERLLQDPVLFNSNYYDADERAITNLQMWKGQVLPDGFIWRDSSNEPHIINSEFIDGLLYAIAVRGTHLYQVSWDKKNEVDALDYDDLLTYDPEINW